MYMCLSNEFRGRMRETMKKFVGFLVRLSWQVLASRRGGDQVSGCVMCIYMCDLSGRPATRVFDDGLG